MASRNVNAFLEGKVESLKISGNLEVAQTWVHLEEFYTRKYVVDTLYVMLFYCVGYGISLQKL